MEWTRGDIMLLINHIKNFPALWDSSDPGYKNKKAKQNSFEEIGRLMDIQPHEIEKKIHSLKVQFSREYCRLKKSIIFKSDEDDIYKPKWFAYEPLLFLRDKGNNELTQNIMDDGATQQSTMFFTRIENMEPIETTSNNKLLPNKRKSENPDQKDVMPKIKAVSSLGDSSDAKDEFTLFGEYVATKLRTLGSIYFQCLAKRDINEAIFKIEMKQIEQSDDSVKTEL